MTEPETTSRFEAELYRPAKMGDDGSWCFLILPKAVSEALPRRGRTTVAGTLSGHFFQATLEPDGQLSHWLKVDERLLKTAGAKAGDTVTMEIVPVDPEPEPEVPADFQEALSACPEARKTWEVTTTIARLDWIQWMTTAKQRKTRDSRVATACDMLKKGKKRVCCFDPSGFYSKSLSAPETAE